MNAIKPSEFSTLIQANRSLRDRMLSLYSIDLQPKDILPHFMSEEHIKICLDAKKLGLISPTRDQISIKIPNKGVVHFNVGDEIPLPSAVGEQAHVIDTKYPFYETLIQWVDAQHEVYKQFEMGEKVIYMLDERMKNMLHVRSYLPGVITLFKVGNKANIATKLSGTPSPRGLAPLPFGARQAISDYNALIAKASLLPEARNRYRDNVRFSAHIELGVLPWNIIHTGEDEQAA